MSIYVALKAAKIAYSTLTKLSKSKGKLTHGEASVIADCRENIDETLDLLSQSSDELANLPSVPYVNLFRVVKNE